MPLVIAFLVLVFAIFNLGNFLNPKKELPPMETSVSQVEEVSPTGISTPKPQSQEESNEPVTAPSVGIDTYIKFGPQNGEIIEDTNKVTFEFKAITAQEENEDRISFETKMDGFDANWKESYSSERTIELPAGPKEYTFSVRAKIKDKGIVDPTPDKRTFKLNISPYYGKVKISQVRPPGFLTSSLITLNTYLEKDEARNITGWKIEGEKGYILLPQGVEKYNPLTTTLQTEDIIIKQGDRIYISSEPNPLGGNLNFKLNKCMGYLKSSHNFPINMPENCPRPQIDKLPKYLEQCCKEYISTLGTCEQPTYSGMEKYGIFKDPNCFSYLNSTFNYAGCFANHYQDSSFLENQWHIYLNRMEREIMDTQLDTIYLKDKNGLLVNKYSYGSTSCCQ